MSKLKTVKISEATGPCLDWLVAKCEGADGLFFDGVTWGFNLNGQTKVLAKGWGPMMTFLPSIEYTQGGPIIEREKIDLHLLYDKPNIWAASLSNPWETLPNVFSRLGPTPLIAAMRCFVASKMGDTFEVPEGLL
jgi:Protein of unknown function (DUF2591)